MELDVGDDRKAKEGGNESSCNFGPDINQCSRLGGWTKPDKFSNSLLQIKCR